MGCTEKNTYIEQPRSFHLNPNFPSLRKGSFECISLDVGCRSSMDKFWLKWDMSVASVNGENRPLVTDEPTEFEK